MKKGFVVLLVWIFLFSNCSLFYNSELTIVNQLNETVYNVTWNSVSFGNIGPTGSVTRSIPWGQDYIRFTTDSGKYNRSYGSGSLIGENVKKTNYLNTYTVTNVN